MKELCLIIFLQVAVLAITYAQEEKQEIKGRIVNYNKEMSEATINLYVKGTVETANINSRGYFTFFLPENVECIEEDFSINPRERFEILTFAYNPNNEYQIEVSIKDNTPSNSALQQDDTISPSFGSNNQTGNEINDNPIDSSKDVQEINEISQPNNELTNNSQLTNTLPSKENIQTNRISERESIPDTSNLDEIVEGAKIQLEEQYKRALEIREQLKIIIDKMDSGNYSEEKKQEIRNKIGNLSQQLKDVIDIILEIQSEIDRITGKYHIPKYLLYLMVAFIAILLITSVFYYAIARIKQKEKEKTQTLNNELSKTTTKLKKAHNELVELQHSKDELVQNIVHDLKAPLAPILDSNDLKDIKTAGNRLKVYIDDILTIQKYKEVGLNLVIQNHNLYDTTYTSSQIFRNLANKRGIDIENNIPRDIFCKYDERYIERVFENLLSNAIKYTSSGGKIIFRVEEKQQQIKIYLQDTGQGIPSDKFEEIFEPFMQLNAKEFANTRSTGIGLSFCKTVIEAHNSEIYVESKLGKGTTFYFELSKTDPIQDYVSKSEEEDKYEEAIKLEEKDISFLKSYIEEIRKIKFYAVTPLKREIAKITTNDSPNIVTWKKEIEDAINNRNKKKYEQLIDLIK